MENIEMNRKIKTVVAVSAVLFASICLSGCAGSNNHYGINEEVEVNMRPYAIRGLGEQEIKKSDVAQPIATKQ